MRKRVIYDSWNEVRNKNMFNQKVLVRILNCSRYDLEDFEKFCVKFKEKYEEDVTAKFIEDLIDINNTLFDCENIINQIWYYLLCHVIERYIEPNRIKYIYEEFYYLRENFANTNFRLKVSDFRDLELEFVRAGVDVNILHKLINDLNWFLER